jgi:hypothetical protein
MKVMKWNRKKFHLKQTDKFSDFPEFSPRLAQEFTRRLIGSKIIFNVNICWNIEIRLFLRISLDRPFFFVFPDGKFLENIFKGKREIFLISYQDLIIKK